MLSDDENVVEDGEDDSYNYKDMIRRDERRWKKADQNGDGALDKKEFQDFLHPEEVEHMRSIVIDVSALNSFVLTLVNAHCFLLHIDKLLAIVTYV